jgi:stage II sporulation protein D
VLTLALLLSGCERREITRPTPQMDIDPRFWVRVLLVADATECTVTAPSSLRISRAGFSEAQTVQPFMTIDGAATVTATAGRLSLGAGATPGDGIVISTESPHILRLNGQDYRGQLRFTLNSDGHTFNVVNLVPLEPYLAGVVGAEMPDYWEPQALKAQAIAARTYCLYTKSRFGRSRAWDVSDTQASQVYRGVSAESTAIWEAVDSTYGMVLMLPTGHSLEDGLFPAYYSAVCGGHTEDSGHVFGDSVGPLRGVSCPYCKDTARLSLFFWPMVQLDRATVTRRVVEKYPKLKALGSITDIVILEKSDYEHFSRLTKIQLVGETGKSDTLRAEDLRLTLDPTGRKIQSTICHIVPWGDGWAFLSGRGWGHGVGLCQYGAQGMARLGKNYREILDHYYPGSQIVDLY